MQYLPWLASLLSSVGAINWGLTIFFNFNLVEFLAGMIKVPYLKRVIYGLVALSGFYTLVFLFM